MRKVHEKEDLIPMKPTSVRKKLPVNRVFLAVLAGGLTPMLNIAADPVSDLRSLSTLKDLDLSKLSRGNVSAAGEPLGQFARGMSVQSAYVVQSPVKSTVSLIQQWNPTRYPKLRIYLQGDLPSGVGPQSFRNLASAPPNSSVRAFVAATERLPGDSSKLQLSSAEVKQYSGGTSGGGGVPGPVVAFWSQVLAERARNFVSGGLSAEPPYQNGVSPASEVARLIDSSGNARSHFSPIISGGRGSPSLSWQLLDADGQAAVSLDAFYAKPVGDGYQILDLGFYSSGGYYVVVTLQQLWPIQVDGRDATLAWRVDLVSSSAFGTLRGVQRLGSDAAVMRNIQENVRAFVGAAGR
jgi:hypothetical protein